MRPVGIVSTGMYVPERVVTNSDLEKTLDTSDEWIYTKVGVRERRIAAPHQATSDLAVAAGQVALKRAGLRPMDIDLIVLATSSPDMIQPSTGAIVQGKLGATNAAAFDVSAVCSGSVFALDVAVGMMQSHPDFKNVLVIAAETYSRILDWSDRTTCVYFGDGAGAAVLKSVAEGYGALGTLLGTDGRKWDVITFLGGGSRYPANQDRIGDGLHRFQMRGRDVWTFATTVVPDAIKEALAIHNLSPHDVDFLVFHQANINIIKANMATLNLPMSKTHTCLERYANTSGASVLMALSEAVELGMISGGDVVVLVGFGGGLTWGVSIWRWPEHGN